MGSGPTAPRRRAGGASTVASGTVEPGVPLGRLVPRAAAKKSARGLLFVWLTNGLPGGGGPPGNRALCRPRPAGWRRRRRPTPVASWAAPLSPLGAAWWAEGGQAARRTVRAPRADGTLGCPPPGWSRRAAAGAYPARASMPPPRHSPSSTAAALSPFGAAPWWAGGDLAARRTVRRARACSRRNAGIPAAETAWSRRAAAATHFPARRRRSLRPASCGAHRSARTLCRGLRPAGHASENRPA